MIKYNLRKAVKVLLFSKKRYLLLFKSSKEDVSPSEWDIPGGGVMPGETSIQALVREVMEETAIDISHSKILPIKTWKINKAGAKIEGTDFLCILDKQKKVRLGEEHSDSRWFYKKEIMASRKIPSWLKETVEKASGLDF